MTAKKLPPAVLAQRTGTELEAPALSARQIKALEYIARGQYMASVRHNMRIKTPEWQEWMHQPVWQSLYRLAGTVFANAGGPTALQILNANAVVAASRLALEIDGAEESSDRIRASVIVLDRTGHAPPTGAVNIDNRSITINQLSPELQERYIKALEIVAKDELTRQGGDASLKPQ